MARGKEQQLTTSNLISQSPFPHMPTALLKKMTGIFCELLAAGNEAVTIYCRTAVTRGSDRERRELKLKLPKAFRLCCSCRGPWLQIHTDYEIHPISVYCLVKAATGRESLYGCEILRIPYCLDNRLTVNCEILATCSSTYSPVRTSQEAHSFSIK
jgi:hypothetical protein